MAAAAPLPAGAAELQPTAPLEALARAEAAPHLPPLTEKQRLLAGPIAENPTRERCSGPITPLAAPGAHMRDRVLIELRCSGTERWHLYVPVRIVGTTAVLLAAHAIVSGSVLSEKDFEVQERDIPTLPPGYMDEPTAALGLTASRPIASGAIITNQMLVGAKAVQRGQTVTLVADAAGLNVRMAGRALTDGLVNQRVRVQNLSSGKIVEGIARSDQVVEIISP